MKQYRIRKDDKVIVTTGKDKGKVGKVLKVLRKKDRVLVEKVNMVKRHTKGNPYTQQPGGIIEKEMPIHISNVMVMCESCAGPVRVGFKQVDGKSEKDANGKKVRFCKKCNKIIE